MPVDAERLLQDKRIVRVGLWFVVDDEIVRVVWQEGDSLPELPRSGCVGCLTKFADGCGDGTTPSGWVVMRFTKHGRLLCASTGSDDEPSEERYPGRVCTRCTVAESGLWHVVAEEMQQWR